MNHDKVCTPERCLAMQQTIDTNTKINFINAESTKVRPNNDNKQPEEDSKSES